MSFSHEHEPLLISGRPPLIMPLGEGGLLIRFGSRLSDEANRAALYAHSALESARLPGVIEIVPSLVSTFVSYDPAQATFARLSGEVRMCLSRAEAPESAPPRPFDVPVAFGGEDGPDLESAAAACGLSTDEFIRAHNRSPLRVLATGFAPGFVYCGLHPEDLTIPRRDQLHPQVPPGSVLFAAGQTAITATPVPTGWYVIGRTSFRNFDISAKPPTHLRAGDLIQFGNKALTP